MIDTEFPKIKCNQNHRQDQNTKEVGLEVVYDVQHIIHCDDIDKRECQPKLRSFW